MLCDHFCGVGDMMDGLGLFEIPWIGDALLWIMQSLVDLLNCTC